jgi:hypothetical protein
VTKIGPCCDKEGMAMSKIVGFIGDLVAAVNGITPMGIAALALVIALLAIWGHGK